MVDKLVLTDWLMILTGIGTFIALIGNLITMRDRGKHQAAADAELRSDVKHIREKVDKLDDMPGRMVKVEESTKQAHKRLDRVEREMESKE